MCNELTKLEPKDLQISNPLDTIPENKKVIVWFKNKYHRAICLHPIKSKITNLQTDPDTLPEEISEYSCKLVCNNKIVNIAPENIHEPKQVFTKGDRVVTTTRIEYDGLNIPEGDKATVVNPNSAGNPVVVFDNDEFNNEIVINKRSLMPLIE